MDELIASIPKNTVEQIRVTRTEYKGGQYLDVRIYYEAEPGKWVPTKKGVTLKAALAAELIAALQKVEAACDTES